MYMIIARLNGGQAVIKEKSELDFMFRMYRWSIVSGGGAVPCLFIFQVAAGMGAGPVVSLFFIFQEDWGSHSGV